MAAGEEVGQHHQILEPHVDNAEDQRLIDHTFVMLVFRIIIMADDMFTSQLS